MSRVHLTRVPGKKGTRLRVQLTLELDASDPAALQRLGDVVRELIPEQDRPAFLDEMTSAAAAAGFLVSLPPL